MPKFIENRKYLVQCYERNATKAVERKEEQIGIINARYILKRILLKTLFATDFNSYRFNYAIVCEDEKKKFYISGGFFAY